MLLIFLTAQTKAASSCSANNPTSVEAQVDTLAQLKDACEDAACNGSGTETKKFEDAQFSVLFSKDKIKKMKSNVDKFSSDKKCPSSCRETILATLNLTSSPVNKSKRPPECNSNDSKIINSPIFSTKSCAENIKDADSWATSVLTGKGETGKTLDAECPVECSYYTTQKIITKLIPGGCEVTNELNIKFGQKREGFMFNFSAEVTKHWNCQSKDRGTQ